MFFGHAQVAAAATKKQKLDLNTSKVTAVSADAPDTVFVGNMPWSATDEDLGGLFADYGEVVNVRIGQSPCPLPKLFEVN